MAMHPEDLAQLIGQAVAQHQIQPAQLAELIGQATSDAIAKQQQGVMPYNYGGDPLGQSQYSGVAIVPFNQGPQVLMRCRRGKSQEGLASVQVHVEDLIKTVKEIPGEQRMILTARWRTGMGGGEAEIDATQGTIFTLSGAESIELDVRLVPANGTAFAAAQTNVSKRVEATVHWGGSISPHPAYNCSDKIQVPASGAQSVPVRIPSQASEVFLLGNNDLELMNVSINFFSVNPGTGVAFASTLAPSSSNPAPVVYGADWFTLSSPTTGQPFVIPVWKMWL